MVGFVQKICNMAGNGSVIPKHFRDKMYSIITDRLKVNPFIPKKHLYFELCKTNGELFNKISLRTFAIWSLDAERKLFSTADFVKPDTQPITDNEKSVTVDPEPDQKYSVENKHYLWNTKRGSLKFSINDVDQMFYEYSEHGLNWSGTQIMNKYNLEPWKWLSIKRTFDLFKKSHIFSPFTVQNTPENELASMMRGKIENALSDKRNIEKVYQDTVTKKYKKDILDDQKKDLAFQVLIDQISDLLPKVSVKPVLHKSKNKTNGVIVVSTADWHLGARVEGLKSTPNYNPEVLKQYLKDAAAIINSQNAKEVHINIIGDVIESFTGKNHVNSFMSIDYSYYGSKVLIAAYELIVWWIGLLNNVKSISGIGGNHDRWSADNKLDTKGEILKVIFYMLKNLYGKNIDIFYDDSIISKNVDGINYILVHGHRGKDRKKLDRIVFEFGDQKVYNMVLGAHLHSRITFDDSRRGRRMCIPSLFTGNEYSEELGFSTLPGILITKNNGKGYPVVEDYPL